MYHRLFLSGLIAFCSIINASLPYQHKTLIEHAITKLVISALIPPSLVTIKSQIAYQEKKELHKKLSKQSTAAQLAYVVSRGFVTINRAIEEFDPQKLVPDLFDKIRDTFFRMHYLGFSEAPESNTQHNNDAFNLHIFCCNVAENFCRIKPYSSKEPAQVQLFRDGDIYPIKSYQDIHTLIHYTTFLDLDKAAQNSYSPRLTRANTQQPRLTARNNNMLFRWPKHLGLCTLISSLTFTQGDRALLTELPSELQYLKRLNYLEITHNKIEKIAGNVIAQLVNLISLNLSQNCISIIPSEIRALTQLQYVNLDSNKISVFPWNLYSLPNLSELMLTNNKFSTIPQKILSLANKSDTSKKSAISQYQTFEAPQSESRTVPLKIYLGENPFCTKF